MGMKVGGRVIRVKSPTIKWTKPRMKQFKKEYKAAVKNGDKIFIFEGNEILVGYAKYLLEYLESRLK